MKPAMVKTALRQKRTAITAYCIAGFASLWLYAGIYPSLAKQGQNLNVLLKSFSPAFLKAFGSYIPGLSNFSLEALLATKQFGFVWPLLLVLIMVSFSGLSIAGEIEQTTLGLWLSAPVSRAGIYWSKFLAGILALIAFIATTVLAIIPLAHLYKIHLNNQHVLLLAAIGSMFGLAIFGLSMMVSALVNSKSKVYALISALLLVMYVLNLIAELNGKFVNLRYFSFFYYYNSTDVLINGTVNRWSYVVFGLTALIGAVAGAVIFKRRNISI